MDAEKAIAVLRGMMADDGGIAVIGTTEQWAIHEAIRALSPPASAAVVPEARKYQHEWNADGERCLLCGDKDWMGGPCGGPRNAAGAG
jgi:hypothetical protein